MLGLWRSDRKAGRKRERVSEREGALERKREGGREREQQKLSSKVSAELSLQVRRGYSLDWATAALQCGTAANLHPTLLSATPNFICRLQHVLPLLLDTGMEENRRFKAPALCFFPFPPGVARLRFVFTVRGLQCCVACRAATCHLLRTKELFPTLLSFPR